MGTTLQSKLTLRVNDYGAKQLITTGSVACAACHACPL